MSTFGNYLRQQRQKKELTLTQLAAKLQIDAANLSKMENGKRSFDSKKIPMLCSLLKLDEESVRKEFVSDQIANIIYDSKVDIDTLKLAEEKVRYLELDPKKREQTKLSI